MPVGIPAGLPAVSGGALGIEQLCSRTLQRHRFLVLASTETAARSSQDKLDTLKCKGNLICFLGSWGTNYWTVVLSVVVVCVTN